MCKYETFDGNCAYAQKVEPCRFCEPPYLYEDCEFYNQWLQTLFEHSNNNYYYDSEQKKVEELPF